MNSSFLYHAWGLYSFECTREEYKGNAIQLFFMCKAKSLKRLVPSAESAIWSRTDTVQGISLACL